MWNMLLVCFLLLCGCEVVLIELQIEVILFYFIIDWDVFKCWISLNCVYSWFEFFYKDGRYFIVVFIYIFKGDIIEFVVFDVMDVERDLLVRKMI